MRRALGPLLLLLAGCPGGGSTLPTLHVSAAASLSDALSTPTSQALKVPGCDVRLNLAASSTLARQIDAGSPCDLFLSANTRWMDYLEQRGDLHPGTRVDLARNTLVLVTPKAASVALKLKRGAAAPGPELGRVALGDPDHVPAGIYAKQALTHLGWWTPLEKRFVFAADVRAALRLVERGECGLGVVYGSDAHSSSAVTVVGTFPPASHEPIRYQGAIIKGRDSVIARRFLKFLVGHLSFEEHGFTLPTPSKTARVPR